MRKKTPSTGPAFLAAAIALAGCKPSSQKTTIGPLTADRYESAAPDGSKLDCYVFGAESNKPARLCGDPNPIPNFAGVLFNAVEPSPASRFVESIGPAMEAGFYLLKPIGSDRVDAWPLGKLPTHDWLGGGKVLLAVETGADHHTRVRLIDPAARAERAFDVGLTKGDSFLLVRADNDEAILLLQRLGGDEMISVRDPVSNPEVTVADASDEKSPGSRKLHKRGDLERMNGGVFKPNLAVTSQFQWKNGQWLFEGAPLGPFTEPQPSH